MLESECARVIEWRDGPGTTYEEHVHATREVRVVLEGTLTFSVDGVRYVLGPGDRIDLEPGEAHAATVGPNGARYLAGTGRA